MYVHMSVHLNIYVCICLCVYVCMYVCMYVYTYACITYVLRMYVRACVCVCVRACVYAYPCLCVYTLYLWYVANICSVHCLYHYHVLYRSVTVMKQIKDLEKKTVVITAVEVCTPSDYNIAFILLLYCTTKTLLS